MHRFNSRTPGGVRLLLQEAQTIERRVSIHAPREGCDEGATYTLLSPAVFQFTHPGRGATAYLRVHRRGLHGFNSRTPGGVRPGVTLVSGRPLTFQFTHPGRGATQCSPGQRDQHQVSIHAPREGCDASTSTARATPTSFNSRTPGGVRLPRPQPPMGRHRGFNSRTPGGVRRSRCWGSRWISSFNSRTPGGVRRRDLPYGSAGCRFNSRTPGGVRLFRKPLKDAVLKFQFTHPGRGATTSQKRSPRTRLSFNSRTPGGVRLGAPSVRG